ncbi:macrolide ABC transporter permease/ATP-binding protein MacB, partial [Bordetella holmesii]|nr:macrolide ABC transporter permease/ATP-binding protein MacB [Bordetella holmesii]
LHVSIPYTTALTRILGQQHILSITVRVSDSIPTKAVEDSITTLMQKRHGTKDFYVFNNDTNPQTIERTKANLTLLES